MTMWGHAPSLLRAFVLFGFAICIVPAQAQDIGAPNRPWPGDPLAGFWLIHEIVHSWSPLSPQNISCAPHSIPLSDCLANDRKCEVIKMGRCIDNDAQWFRKLKRPN